MRYKQQFLILACFGAALLLILIDAANFSLSIGSLKIQVYASAALALLGLVLLWRAIRERYTSR